MSEIVKHDGWILVLPEGAHLRNGPNEIKLVLPDGTSPLRMTKMDNGLIIGAANVEIRQIEEPAQSMEFRFRPD